MADFKVVQCNACKGVYRTVLADGTEYYHACPQNRVITPAVVDKTNGEITTPEVIGKVEKGRDENVVVDPDTRKTSIVSEGEGVTEVTDPAVVNIFRSQKERP